MRMRMRAAVAGRLDPSRRLLATQGQARHPGALSTARRSATGQVRERSRSYGRECMLTINVSRNSRDRAKSHS